MRTLSQKIFRSVMGAVENAAISHPSWVIDPRLARSIAKRATGTLLALPEISGAIRELAPPHVVSDEPEMCGLRSLDSDSAVVTGSEIGATSSGGEWRQLRRVISQLECRYLEQGMDDRAFGVRDALSLLSASMQRTGILKK